MIFYFLKELYPLPHGSDSICFPPLTALTFSILNPEIASGSSSIFAPLFWVCKGRNLFVIRKLYFKVFRCLSNIALLVLRVAKVEMNSDFANFILTFFSPALSNIALPFFAGCKGNYIFISCNALANNS